MMHLHELMEMKCIGNRMSLELSVSCCGILNPDVYSGLLFMWMIMIEQAEDSID